MAFSIIAGILLILIAGAGFVWWKIYTSEEKKLARRIAKLGSIPAYVLEEQVGRFEENRRQQKLLEAGQPR